MEDSAGNVCVPGMTVRVVRSAKEAMEMQVKGSALRTKAGTRLNASSSRSHAIFSVMLCEKQDQENLHTRCRPAPPRPDWPGPVPCRKRSSPAVVVGWVVRVGTERFVFAGRRRRSS